MEDYMKEVWFNGVRFVKDDTTGYYLNSSIRKRLHRYVWEFYNGEIPDGYHIHHTDLDKDNNDISNLELLTAEQHIKLHADLRQGECSESQRQHLSNIRSLASDWHGSVEGKEWHKDQYAKSLGLITEKELTCDNCGATFKSKGSRARFCSNKCKSSFRRKSKVDYVELQCVVCNSTFSRNKYYKNQTCSRSCANKLIWKKRKLNLSK